MNDLAKAHVGIELEDTAMSYAEWKACGFHVIKGSKCVEWSVDGYAQFTADQVRSYNSTWPGSLWGWIQNELNTND